MEEVPKGLEWIRSDESGANVVKDGPDQRPVEPSMMILGIRPNVSAATGQRERNRIGKRTGF
jgi:hypothetical protein